MAAADHIDPPRAIPQQTPSSQAVGSEAWASADPGPLDV
jgi:hypothetical protein